MTSHRSDSQPKAAEPAKVVRLVDAKSARKEATPPSDGIRPTREGPWDPCRFQEYEVSPEFRKQIMMAKPPPADPSLFVETMPPTPVAEIVPPQLPELQETITLDPLAFQGIPLDKASPFEADEHTANPQTAAPVKTASGPSSVTESQPRGAQRVSPGLVRWLILVGALLGIVAGFVATRVHKQSGEPRLSSSVAGSDYIATSATPVNVQREPQTSEGTPGAVQASSSPVSDQQHAGVVERAQAKQAATSSKTTAKSSAIKHRAQPNKANPPEDSFPMSPDD